MSKVKITEEQASKIEMRKQDFSNESTIKKHLEGWEALIILNSLTLDELIRALYIGYEIEQVLKTGDWVVGIRGTWEGVIGKLGASFVNRFDFREGSIKNGDFRRATKEEVEKCVDRKLDKLLLDLDSQERVRLHEKLNCHSQFPTLPRGQSND